MAWQSCPYCEQKANGPDQMRKHIQKVHPNEAQKKEA